MSNENSNDQLVEITPQTMAVVPIEASTRKDRSCVILEEVGERTVHLTSKQILEESCRFFGSSLRGRIEGTASITGITHKPPVIIDSPKGMYFFPTSSPQSNDCIWLSHSHIEKITEIPFKQTEIHFINGKTLALDVSFNTMKNQIMRTAQFRFVVENRGMVGKGNPQMKQFINPFAKNLYKGS